MRAGHVILVVNSVRIYSFISLRRSNIDKLAIWLSGNTLVYVNIIALCQYWLGCVTFSRLVKHPGIWPAAPP